MGAIDYVIQLAKIVASSVAEETNATLVRVSGLEDPLGDGDDELVDEQPAFPGIGPVWRPLKPGAAGGRDYHAEVVCAKTEDGLVPIAWRDLRIFRAFPGGLAEGQVALAGYGKGYYSLTLTSGNSGSEKANIHVLYCPYQFAADGTPAKAHTIVIDPTSGAEAVTITHGDGMKVELKSSKVTLTAPTLDLNGVTIDSSGNLTSPAEIKAMGTPGVKLSTHLHPTAMGPSGAPTPGT